MNEEMENYEVITLEDGMEYFIIDEIIDDDKNHFVYLTSSDEENKFRVRKEKIVGNIEMLVGLDSDQEFDKAMLLFTKKHGDNLK